MTTFPRSPRLQKGAIVGIDLFNPVASVIVFQYNPETLSRSLQGRFTQADGGRAEPLRIAGPPSESISLSIELDATDQLERAEEPAVSSGIFPQLSALEALLYPKAASVIRNRILLLAGTLEIVPPAAPLTLFIWGARRILPVRIESLSITEQAFDPNLNPIRAEVSLTLQVLTYDDLPATHPGFHLFLNHQLVKEALAVVGSVSDLSGVAGGELRGI